MQITSELEYELETHKQKLVNEGEDYNTIDAFRLIDLSGQGAVNQQEIFDFLLRNFANYKFTQHELDLFMIRFDKYDKQKIKYSEFCQAFAPQEAQSQQLLVQRQPNNTQLEKSYEQIFSARTRELFEQTWKMHFISESIIEQMRQ